MLNKIQKNGLSRWVIRAATLPVAFAQVREDPLLDLWVLNRFKRKTRIIMVASGGCTAAALTASGKLSHLYLIDPNPAQLVLTRLKLHLLFNKTSHQRMAILGHVPMAPAKRKTYLSDLWKSWKVSLTALGPIDLVAKQGPDCVGRYESLFAQLRHELVGHEEAVMRLLTLRNPKQQNYEVSDSTELGEALVKAFRRVMALPNLVHLFGVGATANRHESFADHFIHRTRHILETQPARENPYLAQILFGKFLHKAFYPWLTMAAPGEMPTTTYTCTPMASALHNFKDEMDVVHLSNILDWLTPNEASQTLRLAWTALRPGGYVVIRQLNSTLKIPSLGKQFVWQEKASQRLYAQDRSFFYRAFFLGRKT